MKKLLIGLFSIPLTFPVIASSIDEKSETYVQSFPSASYTPFASCEQKASIHNLGLNYLKQKHYSADQDEELRNFLIGTGLTPDEVQKMAADYKNEINVGTIIAKKIFGGDDYNKDDHLTQGYILVGLSQLIRCSLQDKMSADSDNLFRTQDTIKEIFAPFMHSGLNLIISQMTGVSNVPIIGTLEEEGLVFEDRQANVSEVASPEYIHYLIGLSKEFSDGALWDEWSKLGSSLYLRFHNDNEEYDKQVNSEINRVLDVIKSKIDQEVFENDEAVKRFFSDNISVFATEVIRSSLYPNENSRSASRLVKNVLRAKEIMAELTTKLLVKQNRHLLSSPDQLGKLIYDFLNSEWLYGAICKSFTLKNGKYIPTIENKEQNVWREFFSRYMKVLKPYFEEQQSEQY